MQKIWMANLSGDKVGSIAFPSEIPVIVDGVEQIGWRKIQYKDGVFEVYEQDIKHIVIVGCGTPEQRQHALRTNKGPVYGVISVGSEKPSDSFVESCLSADGTSARKR